MIIPARVAKLYQYIHDPEFSRVMRHIEGAIEEGLPSYKLDVGRLPEDVKLDLLEALDDQGYNVVYDPETEEFEVMIE